DDYDELKANPLKVIWEKILFNAFPEARNMSAEEFARAAMEQHFLDEARTIVNDEIREKYGVLTPYPDFLNFSPYVDNLFNQYRGIKELAIDLRRCPEKVYEVCEYMDEKNLNIEIEKLNALPDGHGVGIKNYYDSYIGALAHTVLNGKQTER